MCASKALLVSEECAQVAVNEGPVVRMGREEA
jgi:hypothetical protein